MSKVSPIAQYLTENKAITKRENNIWHFFSKEGLYLGKQIKLEQNGASAYIREIYGDCFKRLYYECKVVGGSCIYYREDESPTGISIIPTYSYILSHTIDFIKNITHTVQIEKKLVNNTQLIAIEPNVNIGIYDVKKPFVFKEKYLQDKTNDLKKGLRVKHTLH